MNPGLSLFIAITHYAFIAIILNFINTAPEDGRVLCAFITIVGLDLFARWIRRKS